MKIAHVADLHLTTTAGETGMTLAEQVEMAKWIGEDAYSGGAELMLFAGDLFDTISTPDVRQAAIETMMAWADRMPVIGVWGNHDRPRDLTYLNVIRANRNIYIEDRPCVHVTSTGTAIACLPWPRKAELVQRLDSVDALEVQNIAGVAMRAVLRGFELDLAKDEYPSRILLAHADLGTALLDNGQPVTGKCDIELGEADLLGVGADYVALGHIHKHQVIRDRLCYAGSPRPTKFPSETGTPAPHGYCLVDVERDREPEIEHRRTPYRELVTVEAVWSEEHSELVTPEGLRIAFAGGDLHGAAVKIKYEVSDLHRAAAAEQAAAAERVWRDAGAVAVKHDAKTKPTYRVRSTAIQKAHSTSDRIRAYWEARGNAPAKPAQLRMIAKLGELEEATLCD